MIKSLLLRMKLLLGAASAVDKILELGPGRLTVENLPMTAEALLELSQKWGEYSISDIRMLDITVHTNTVVDLMTDLQYVELLLSKSEFVDKNWTASRMNSITKPVDDFLTSGSLTVKPIAFLPEYLNLQQEIYYQIFENEKNQKQRSYYLRRLAPVLDDLLTLNLLLIKYFSNKA